MYEKEIKDRLQSMKDAGKSNSEIARELKIPASAVTNILSGYREIKNTSVEFLLKVFPRCKIFLDGVVPAVQSMSDQSVAVGDNSMISTGIVGGNNTITVIGKGSSGIPDDIRRDIVNSTVLSPSEKVEMLKELMKKE